MILHRATHVINTEEVNVYKCIYSTRRTPMAVIQSENKKNQQENKDTKAHADEAAHTG